MDHESSPTWRRRQITKGAAWSVPVLLTGQALPAASASATCSSIGVSVACVAGGTYSQSAPRFTITTGQEIVSGTATLTMSNSANASVTFSGSLAGAVTGSAPSWTINLADLSNGAHTLGLTFSRDFPNNANPSVFVLTVTAIEGQTCSGLTARATQSTVNGAALSVCSAN